MNITYNNKLSVEDYCALRKAVGWYDIPENIIQQALSKSDFIISAKTNNLIIGMARLITDGVQALIMDVIVHPDYQGKGIGKGLMERIMQYLENTYTQMVVNLTTHDSNVGFYEKLGFNNTDISGMRSWFGIK